MAAAFFGLAVPVKGATESPSPAPTLPGCGTCPDDEFVCECLEPCGKDGKGKKDRTRALGKKKGGEECQGLSGSTTSICNAGTGECGGCEGCPGNSADYVCECGGGKKKRDRRLKKKADRHLKKKGGKKGNEECAARAGSSKKGENPVDVCKED